MGDYTRQINYKGQDHIATTYYEKKSGEVVTYELWNAVLGALVTRSNAYDNALQQTAAFESNFLLFQQEYRKFTQDFEVFKSSRAQFESDTISRFRSLESAIDGLRVRQNVLETNTTSRFIDLESFVSGLETADDEIRSALTVFDTDINTLKSDVAQRMTRSEVHDYVTDKWLGVNALAIQNTISGGEKSLTVNDVSPLEHKCSLKLTSDTYETAVGESRNILNLETASIWADMRNNMNYSELNAKDNNDGSITVSGKTPPYDVLCLSVHIKGMTIGKQYTFSVRSDNPDIPISYYFLGFDSENMPIVGYDETINSPNTFTFGEGGVEYYAADIFTITHENEPYVEIGETTFYIQLEEGSQMTDWQPAGGDMAIVTKPYIEDFSTVKVNVNGTEYTPKADGTVTDIDSISPTMEITTDNEHANICDFTYCADTKKYIDAGTQYEVITEITVEEATKYMVIPLGKERKSVKLYIKTPIITTAGSGSVAANGTNVAILGSAFFSTSQAREILVEIDVINGFGTLGKSRYSTNNLSLSTPMDAFNDGVYTPFSELALNRGSLFEAGTTIKVWGNK